MLISLLEGSTIFWAAKGAGRQMPRPYDLRC